MRASSLAGFECQQISLLFECVKLRVRRNLESDLYSTEVTPVMVKLVQKGLETAARAAICDARISMQWVGTLFKKLPPTINAVNNLRPLSTWTEKLVEPVFSVSMKLPNAILDEDNPDNGCFPERNFCFNLNDDEDTG